MHLSQPIKPGSLARMFVYLFCPLRGPWRIVYTCLCVNTVAAYPCIYMHIHCITIYWIYLENSKKILKPNLEELNTFGKTLKKVGNFHNRKVKKTPLSVVQGGSNMDLRGYPPNLLVSTGDCLETTCRMAFRVMWSILDIQLTTLDWRCNHSGLLQKYGDC